MNKLASLMPIGEPRSGGVAAVGGHPLFRLGFRPFYLLAAIFAVISIPMWLASYGGHLGLLPNVNLLWHMHEMVFGFAVAVVAGFLFTAVRNWTGLWTPHGPALAAIAAVWVAGRIAMLIAPPALAAAVDLLFIPVAIAPLASVMLRSGKRSNLPLLGLLVLLLIANACFHASVLGWAAPPATTTITAAILILGVLSTIIGGRVIPGFTKNMAPGSTPKSYPLLDKAGVALTIGASAAWIAALPAMLVALLACACGIVQLARVACWQPLRTLAYPLLWILHLAYAWLAVGFALLGLSELGLVGTSTAVHAIALGGMSSLIVGMMTRTTIGHTGRVMRATHKESLIFFCLLGATLLRLLANLVMHDRALLLTLSGLCWVAGFLTFAIVFGTFLCTPRVDGREG